VRRMDQHLVLNDLIYWLETSPPAAEVVSAIWDALRAKSLQCTGDDRNTIFGTLFRMSSMVSHGEVMAMRRDYQKAIHTGACGWIDYNDSEEWYIPWNPLEYPGGGLGIPWERDGLSARHSWSTHFGRLTHLNPDEAKETHADSAFRYLAPGVFPMYQIDLRKRGNDRVRMPPPSAPFEASPWQKARELHLCRPDW
jgi:hypothetical protein